jgi:hypothetical protein
MYEDPDIEGMVFSEELSRQSKSTLEERFCLGCTAERLHVLG